MSCRGGDWGVIVAKRKVFFCKVFGRKEKGVEKHSKEEEGGERQKLFTWISGQWLRHSVVVLQDVFKKKLTCF